MSVREPVPDDFIAAVEQARLARESGDLAMLAAEAQFFPWARAGLRVTGRAQSCLIHAPRSLSQFDSVGQVLLFTGHMIDRSDRAAPRFPAAQEQAAKTAIRVAVLDAIKAGRAGTIGLSGGACGGDILFHEVCAELGIASQLFLALPRDKFVQTSVQHGGEAWVARFDTLYATLPSRVLAESATLPHWLRSKAGYGIWVRNNLWTLQNALAYGAEKLTLIALWDGETSDEFGGTEDMIGQARACGARIVHLNTRELFHLRGAPADRSA